MRVLKDQVLLEDFKDRRGRRYARADVQQQIEGKKFYGEFNSDHGPDINLSNVSHSLENVAIRGDDLVCDLVVLDTPAGKIVEALLDAGVGLRTSIRATGMLDDGLAVSDLTLITFDLVREET